MPKRDLIIIASMTLFMLALAGVGVGIMIWQSGGLGDRPEDAPKFVSEGDLALSEYDFERAVRLYSRAVEADPEHAPAFAARGGAYAMWGDYASANEDFRTALHLDPQNIDAHVGLAGVALAWGESKRAIDHYRRAIEIAPDDPSLKQALAATFYGSGAEDEAIAVYDTMIDAGMGDERIYTMRAQMRTAAGDLEGAVEDYTNALDLASNGLQIAAMRGDVYQQLGEFEKAAADLEAAHIALPWDSNITREYAWALWGLGRDEDAAALLKENLENGNVTLHDYFSLGATLMHLGRYEEAKPYLERAVSFLTQGLDYASLYLWIAHAHLGEREQGDRMLREKLASPDYRFTPFATILAKRLLGDMSEETLIADFAQPAPDHTPQQKTCEGYFYMGAKRRAEGDEPGALDFFRKCVETNIRNYYEWNAARAELQRVEETQQDTE